MVNFNNTDPSRPSFFEMVAQKEMMNTLMPAIKWAFSVRKVFVKLIKIRSFLKDIQG